MEPSKKDWKLFQEKIKIWQEAYMEKLIKAYILLMEKDLPASTKFWELENRIKEDKRKPGVLLTLRKSEMIFDLLLLMKDDVIVMDDLSDFSEDLKEQITLLRSHSV
ncbi:MAG: multidrug transporter [Clostridia bacterium]|nr:multidrug transporter [Clostridia bacterium]